MKIQSTETFINRVKRLSPAGSHCFGGGYFDKYQDDPSGRFLLCLKAPFMDRMPAPDDKAEIGLIDRGANNSYHPLNTTNAWCWQQGCMLQWLSGGQDTCFLFNDRDDDGFVARITDTASGMTRRLPRAVYAVSPDGALAACCNFSRLADERPGYGYEGVPDPGRETAHPDDDGLWLMNTRSGVCTLAVSIDQLYCFPPKRDHFDFGKHRLYHILFSTDGRRLFFLHRWQIPYGGHLTRFFTVDNDGRNLYLLNDKDMTSHASWFAADKIIAFANESHWGYYEYIDRSSEVTEIAAGFFFGDGHCTYSPDGKWMLTDSYPDDAHCRTLSIYNLADRKKIDLGRFFSPPIIDTPLRCDLHPRWSRDGYRIYFDSLHEGFRGIYQIELDDFFIQYDKKY